VKERIEVSIERGCLLAFALLLFFTLGGAGLILIYIIERMAQQ
jgi:hypothetical protein